MSEEEAVTAAAAKEAPKRTPRKRAAAAADSEKVAGAVTDSAASSEPKPRKTRTKKAASAESAELSEGSAEEAPKRRTRRKKAEDADAAEQSSFVEAGAGEGSAEEAKPKAPRSSRAKAKKEQPGEQASEKAEVPAAEKPASQSEDGKGGERAEGSSEPKSEASDAEVGEGQQQKGRNRQKRQQRQQKNQQQGHQKNNRQKDNFRNGRHQRKQNRREPVVPQTSKEDLAKMKVAELREKAAELELDVKGLKKAELVEAVFAASVKAEGFIEVSGILDVLSDGYGFLRTRGYLPSEDDVYVGTSTIRRNNLRKGDYLTGQTRPARPNEKFAALQRIDTVNGKKLDELGKRVRFADLTPVFPDERLVLEHGRSAITSRVIDLCAPIGKGQRGLIVSPPKAGKTTILKDIAASITANNPEVHLMCLLVDERPEEVTDMQRSIHGEVISSTFDMPCENHVAVSEMVIERAKRLVEDGEDVVILLDSLTRLARAYNLAQPASGRILSGGVDSTALYPPKKFLGAARNIEGGGSLTILASALIETGSKMDEVIFEEFKGTGNMEVKLDRSLAEHRVFPAIDPVASGTRREDLLLDPQEAPLIWAVRRVLSNRNNVERAMDSLIKALKQTNDNQEFLIRAAKKAQGRHFDDNSAIEF